MLLLMEDHTALGLTETMPCLSCKCRESVCATHPALSSMFPGVGSNVEPQTVHKTLEKGQALNPLAMVVSFLPKVEATTFVKLQSEDTI
jgi:hypothetical protein